MSDTCNVLMDTSVLLELVHESNRSTKKLIQEYAGNKKINFIILEDILTEWFGVGSIKYPYSKNVFKNRNELKNELIPWGTVTEISTWYESKESVWVEKMYRSKKHIWNLSRTSLSRNDCRLLKYALDNSCTLVSLDRLLIKAYCFEAKEVCIERNILVPTDREWKFD